ncbi:MAG: hypothetical protein ACREBU_07420 [Nitrososphaera sp.]
MALRFAEEQARINAGAARYGYTGDDPLGFLMEYTGGGQPYIDLVQSILYPPPPPSFTPPAPAPQQAAPVTPDAPAAPAAPSPVTAAAESMFQPAQPVQTELGDPTVPTYNQALQGYQQQGGMGDPFRADLQNLLGQFFASGLNNPYYGQEQQQGQFQGGPGTPFYGQGQFQTGRPTGGQQGVGQSLQALSNYAWDPFFWLGNY